MLSKRTSVILLSAIFLGSNCFAMELSNNEIPEDENSQSLHDLLSRGDFLTLDHLRTKLDPLHQRLQELQESTNRTQQLAAGMATQADLDDRAQLLAAHITTQKEIIKEYKIHWIIEAVLRCFGVDDAHPKDE